MTTRVLVVDDTSIFRRIVSDALSAIPGVEVVGTASNGKLALARMAALQPDLITLDIEMPEMNGIEVLEAMRASGQKAVAIMLSSLTVKGGEMTIHALEAGAFDFITKPEGKSQEANLAQLRDSLRPMIQALAHQREIRGILKTAGLPTPATKRVPQSKTVFDPPPVVAAARSPGRTGAPIVLIGVSTGGPTALAEVLPAWPPKIGAPIFIVQHMPPLFTEALAQLLQSKSAIRVKEAQHGEVAQADCAYLAPGGRQMKLGPGQNGEITIRITDDPPENACRPSVDYLFRSVALHFPGRAIAAILTGMGNDGTAGTRMLKRSGSFTIAQDEATCVVFGMPREAILAGVIDTVVPLSRIADTIVRAVAEARGMIKLLPEERQNVAQYIHSICAITLDQSKDYLIESRLSGVMAESKSTSFTQLVSRARSDGALRRRIVDEITTNETLFFRDSSPFDLLRFKIIPEIIDRRAKFGLTVPIRIWSAACSTGQEIYSIAIVPRELLGDMRGYNVRLVGTDISDQAVARASEGIFSQIEIDRGLTGAAREKSFVPHPRGWKIRDEIRAMVSFRKLNLMDDFTSLGNFDIVFCRNVAIYFNERDRASLFKRIEQRMDSNGYLVIGSMESLSAISPQFESKRHLRSVYYQVKSAAAARI